VIYPVDSIIQLSNDWGLPFKAVSRSVALHQGSYPVNLFLFFIFIYFATPQI